MITYHTNHVKDYFIHFRNYSKITCTKHRMRRSVHLLQ
jgi:hypothetical protein